MNRVTNRELERTVDLLLNSTVFKFKFLHYSKFDEFSLNMQQSPISYKQSKREWLFVIFYLF